VATRFTQVYFPGGIVHGDEVGVVNNIAICLIHQANYLLDQQIRRLEQDFIKEGGIREKMTRARLQYRNNKQQPGEQDANRTNKSHMTHKSNEKKKPQ
jgi:four helix bundle suffix protein